jgi:hypothetical protein
MGPVRLKLLLAAASLCLAAQPKPAALEGLVANSVTGAPIKKAIVTLRCASENWGHQALTDAAGRFRLENLQPGQYALWAEAEGFVRNPPPSLSLTLTDGQAVKDFAIQLIPFGAISGKALDENGDPITGATVEALRYAYSRNGRSLETKASATSNDRGEFRLFNLQPGRWYIAARKYIDPPTATGRVHGARPEEEYPQTYYPGVSRPDDATAVELTPGAELTQVAFPLRKARVYHIRGKLIDARTRQPVSQSRVLVANRWYVTARPDGSFDMRGMPPGTYSLLGQATGEDKVISNIRQVLITDRDVNDQLVELAPPFVLRGVALVDGAPPANSPSARVTLEGITGAFGDAGSQIQPDGSFIIYTVAPQPYRVRIDRLPPGLYLKSIQFGDQDVTADGRIDPIPGSGPLTLTLGSDAGTVEGTVKAGPLPVSITLIPDDRPARFDLYQTVDLEDSSFRFRSVPPGSYKVFVWEVTGDKQLEEFRKPLEPKAASITVRPGDRQTIQPRLITAAEVEEAQRSLR